MTTATLAHDTTEPVPPAYGRLEQRFGRIGRLRSADSLLFWDSRTQMPPGAGAGRAETMGALREQMHELLADPALQPDFDAAQRELNSLDPWQRANLDEMLRQRLHATALSAPLVGALSRAGNAAQEAWARAKQEQSFAVYRDALARMLDLTLEASAAKAAVLQLDPFDVALDAGEPGLRAARVDTLFDDLSGFLPGFAAEAEERTREHASIDGSFDVAAQRALSERVLHRIGYDFRHGRLDTTSHPFATAAVPGDYRITTRFDADGFLFGLMATIHEAGHSFYEAALPAAWAYQPVGTSLGGVLHESQSLLFEMQASRSDAFLAWLAGELHVAFGGKADRWSTRNVRDSYRRVRRGTVRLEADEATYPLHIILRYRIERALFDGTLSVDDIPEAWNETTRTLLGRVPENDAVGCLQDVHWSLGMFGYFPTYCLGALAAAQMFARASGLPAVQAGLATGDLRPLRAWAGENVHQHGRRFDTFEIIRRATGQELGTGAFKAHLAARYGAR